MSAPRTKGHDLPPGIRRRHARSCPAIASDDLQVCDCRPSYQAQAGPRSDRRTETHRTLSAAKGWKRDIERAFAGGELTGEKAPRFRSFADAFIRDATAGIILARGDKPYRASTIREYAASLKLHGYPTFGDHRVDDISRTALNEFAMGLRRAGMAAQTVKNTLMPIRAVLRHAVDIGLLPANPSNGMKVPAGSGKRTRFLSPTDLDPYLRALDVRDRALWATAIYGGLRRAELMALRWRDVDLAGGVIHVAQTYDPSSGVMDLPKSEAGIRDVPIAGALRDHLTSHRQTAGPRPTGLVFRRGCLAAAIRGNNGDPASPFNPQTVSDRAARRWIKAGLSPVGLHDCRHTFASLMIAAMATSGTFNPKTLQTILGHTSIQLTYDRYGHLFPGEQDAAMRLLDGYLEVQADQAGRAVREATTAITRALDALDQVHDDGVVPEVTRMVQAGQTWLRERAAVPSATPDGGGAHGDQVRVCRTQDRTIL